MSIVLVVSGIPASGKTTIARGLSEALELEMWDKDEILDDLFNKRASEMRSRELFSVALLIRFFRNEP